MRATKALLIVDMQIDFCPGGSLAVPGGDHVVPALNKYVVYFKKKKYPIFASRDWHPVHTSHFRDFGGQWPVHCLQNSRGSAFHPDLKFPGSVILLYKGMDPGKDSYSVFQAEDFSGRLFAKVLEVMGIKELYVGGLAADYCVKATVLDALKRGVRVRLLTDAIKGVDLKAGDSEKAIAAMVARGAKKFSLKNIKS